LIRLKWACRMTKKRAAAGEGKSKALATELSRITLLKSEKKWKA